MWALRGFHWLGAAFLRPYLHGTWRATRRFPLDIGHAIIKMRRHISHEIAHLRVGAPFLPFPSLTLMLTGPKPVLQRTNLAGVVYRFAAVPGQACFNSFANISQVLQYGQCRRIEVG